MFSELAGEVLYGATLDDQDPDEEDDPELEEYYRSTATYAIRGVIANLIDAGILHVNEGLL